MDRELAMVLGMSISYAASLAGMFIAIWAYKRNEKRREAHRSAAEDRSAQGPGSEPSS